MTRMLSAVLALSLVVAASATAQDPTRPPQQKPATARISGRVVAADTGAPIAGVTLSLLSWEVMRAPRSAVTDAQGRFEFAGLVAARYELEARAERYVTLKYGQRRPGEALTPIDLGEGDRFDTANIALPRTSAIEGRILDEFGDPAPNVTVQLSQLEFAAGRRRLYPMGSRNAGPTDDKGQFRIYNLAPGDYYLMALTGAFTDQDETGGFAPTFYPDTPEGAAAAPVRVGVGEDVTSVVITLVPARMARLSGVLTDASGRPVAASVMLAPSDRSGTLAFTIGRRESKPDGSFLFRNVPSGSYTLQAFGPSVPGGNAGSLSQATFGWLPVTVAGRDLTDLAIRVAPGATARGRIVLESADSTAPPKANEVRVSPRPIEFDSAPIVGGGPPPWKLNDDWTFEIGNLAGLGVIRADLNSPLWTLKRVMLDGKDVTDTPVDFRNGDVNGLEVVLTDRGASVDGAVIDADGTPSKNYTVVIFAVNPARWTFPSRFVAVARPNQEGRFKVQGLPSEDYLAVALPIVRGFEWQDPDFLRRVAPGATHFTLLEGEAKSLDLKLPKQGS